MSYSLTFSFNGNTPKVDNVTAVINNSDYWSQKKHVMATLGEPLRFFVDRSSQLDASGLAYVDANSPAVPMSSAMENNILRGMLYVSQVIGKGVEEVANPEDANFVFLARNTTPAQSVTTIINGKEVGVGGFAQQRYKDSQRELRYTFDIVLAPNAPYTTVVHELGHALGLEHPHETSDGDLHSAYNPGITPEGDYIMGYGSLSSLRTDSFNTDEVAGLQSLWAPINISASGLSRLAEQAYFLSPGRFFKKPSKFKGDTITGFDPDSGSIYLDSDAFSGVSSKAIDVRYVYSYGEAKKAGRTSKEFILDFDSGSLFYNANGPQKGFGLGGIFASFPGIDDFNSGALILT